VPFTTTISEDEKDKFLAEKLQAELSGILNWAIEGCYEWREKGLQTPRRVLEATASYQASEDVVASLLAAHHFTSPVRSSDLFSEFMTWCSSNLVSPVPQKTFNVRLKSDGWVPQKRSSGIFWTPTGSST